MHEGFVLFGRQLNQRFHVVRVIEPWLWCRIDTRLAYAQQPLFVSYLTELSPPVNPLKARFCQRAIFMEGVLTNDVHATQTRPSIFELAWQEQSDCIRRV